MRKEKFIAIGLTTALALLLVICLTHLLVMLGFACHSKVSPFFFPLAIAMGFVLSYFFTRQSITTKDWLLSCASTGLLLTTALVLSWFYFDLSWDGQWYQQSAVYDLGGSWNPLFKPMQTTDAVNHPSVLHFPKSYWYFGAAVFKVFGTVEVGKAYNWMAMFIAFPVVYTFCHRLKLSSARSLLITLLVIINPVVLSEVTTYLNDGDLYLFWITYLAALALWHSEQKRIYLLLSIMSAICLVNGKFTGLVFFLASSFFFFVYIIITKKSSGAKFIRSQLITALLAVIGFGYNPYVTNSIYRKHPLYPLMGTKAFPSVFETTGQDDNELYETPANMRGKSLPVRLLYANFGAPGNAPYNGEDSANLVFPFSTNYKRLRAYEYHETRVSGFGPVFGLSLLLAIPAMVLVLARLPKYRTPVIIFLLGLFCCLCFSKHFWWPRFFPFFWMLPIVSLLLLWLPDAAMVSGKIRKQVYEWLFATVIACNAVTVAYIHLKWETHASISLRDELTQLSAQPRTIVVKYGFFKRAIEERFHHWNISFIPGEVPKDSAAHKLTSVVQGYPNQVRYKFR